jgi:hypothetical protein
MRRWGISPTKAVLGLFVLLWSHSALAQARTDLRPIRRLNVAPFYLGVEDRTELIQVINRYADDIRTGLSMAGYGQLAEQVIGEIRDGNLETTSLPVGTTFEFMLFRHTVSGRDRATGRQFVRGEVDVIRNLYWAGNAPVQAYTFWVEDQQARYRFAIPFGPRGCSNLALIERRPFPACVLRVSRAAAENCWTIDASASYGTEDIVTVTVTVSNAAGEVLLTQDGRTAFEWCCPSPGTYTVRVVVTNREGVTRECTDTITCAGQPPRPDLPPRCVLIVSPEDVLSGQTVTIDATGASDPENCIQSNVVEIRDPTGAVLLSANGNEVIFFRFRQRGTYTIINTVTDCNGQVTVCERTVSVSRKRAHFLVSLGGMYEKRTDLSGEQRIPFDIGLVVQTDPWPVAQFIRATIQNFSVPPGAVGQTFRIQVFRDGALIGEGASAVFEMMLPCGGAYRVEGSSSIVVGGQTVTDSETIAFNLVCGENRTFTERGDGTDVVVPGGRDKDSHWYLPLKLGFSYELVSNIEAAIYGGVAIALDDLEESALFADFELNYRRAPVMLGVGLGWWAINHSDRDRIDFLVNAGIIFAQRLLGSESWTFLVQGRYPLNREDIDGDGRKDEEWRIFFGIRLDF